MKKLLITLICIITLIISTNTNADCGLKHNKLENISVKKILKKMIPRTIEGRELESDINNFDVFEISDPENFTGHCALYKRSNENSNQYEVSNYDYYRGDAVMAGNRTTIYTSTHEITAYKTGISRNPVSYHATKPHEIVAVECGKGGKFLAIVEDYAEEFGENYLPIFGKDIARLKPLTNDDIKKAELNRPYINSVFENVDRLVKIDKMSGFVIQGHCVFKQYNVKDQATKICRNNSVCHLMDGYETKDPGYMRDFDNGKGRIYLKCEGLNGVNSFKLVSGSGLLVKGNLDDNGKIDAYSPGLDQVDGSPAPGTVGIVVAGTGSNNEIITVQLFPPDFK